MTFSNAHIPYGTWWSSPFCRWQGSLARSHSIEVAAGVARRLLDERGIATETFDGLVLGTTVPQRQAFYGAPWLASMLGAPNLTGATVAQACATSARVLSIAAHEVEAGTRECVLTVACDRTSNGPHVYYPDPGGVGGRGAVEDPVLDSFDADPNTGQAMLRTAENVAREAGIGREEQDAMALLRDQQYQASLAEDRAFQRRYMVPIELPGRKGKVTVVEADEGIHPSTAEGLAKLRPVLEDGTVTFGTQTHPADGNAGLVVCSKDRAERLAREPGVPIRVLGFGEARVAKGLMPMAVVPAARRALESAGVELGQVAAFKTHNPFAVNDVYFCRETGLDPERVNRFGSPLVYGHPQAPTGLRAMIELLEELRAAGGGLGLFSGCAAGDTAMAAVFRVG